jgi:hypothetical protein
MQLSLSASGSAAEADQQILEQAKNAAKQSPASAPLIYATRDELRRHIALVKDDETISVSASVSISTTVTKKPAAAAAPKEKAAAAK